MVQGAQMTCTHDFVSADYTLTSHPPQTPVICRRCGHKENLIIKIAQEKETYDQVVKRFKEKQMDEDKNYKLEPQGEKIAEHTKNAFSFFIGGKLAFRIVEDGVIELQKGVTINEASMAFWNAVNKFFKENQIGQGDGELKS